EHRTTAGLAAGQRNTLPLLRLRDEATMVVIVSRGGRPKPPQWYTTLRAHPQAVVQVGRRRWPVRARTATAAERADWWPRVLATYKGYSLYESNTDRVIPVVFLEPWR